MPILNFEIVEDPKIENLARQLADAAGVVFETHAGNVWVKVHFLPKSQYGENGGVAEDLNPVFVSALLGQSYGKKDQAVVAVELTEAIAKILNRPKQNIHIIFEPNLVGRVAFGGKLLTER